MLSSTEVAEDFVNWNVRTIPGVRSPVAGNRQRPAVKCHHPRARLVEPGEDVEQRRLPAPLGPMSE